MVGNCKNSSEQDFLMTRCVSNGFQDFYFALKVAAWRLQLVVLSHGVERMEMM